MRCVAGTVSVLVVSCGRPNSGSCYNRGVSHSRVYGDIAGFVARLDGHQRNGCLPGGACAQCSHHAQEITAAASFL